VVTRLAKRTDYRSDEAVIYRRLYKLAGWKRRRLDQLTRDPLCSYCLAAGITTAATIADHVIPHRGDLDLFWYGSLQSLCKLHHDSTKAREENGGWDSMTDADGYPVDPKHPANRV
jgi:5-methylcytosine-specific restriction protein A